MPEENLVKVKAGDVFLTGDLNIPKGAKGLVLFAHGSGSSRKSPRNRFVAEILQKAHLGTLLIDLLTPEEDAVDHQTTHLRFDIEMLTRRLGCVAKWLHEQPATQKLKVGYFGASTGAAAALSAAAEKPALVAAVVSRGGRPDLAGLALSKVRAPTLLIVGGDDGIVVDLNKEAFEQLKGQKKIVIIPGASHLFEEPGALEEVAHLAQEWFTKHLS